MSSHKTLQQVACKLLAYSLPALPFFQHHHQLQQPPRPPPHLPAAFFLLLRPTISGALAKLLALKAVAGKAKRNRILGEM